MLFLLVAVGRTIIVNVSVVFDLLINVIASNVIQLYILVGIIRIKPFWATLFYSNSNTRYGRSRLKLKSTA